MVLFHSCNVGDCLLCSSRIEFTFILWHILGICIIYGIICNIAIDTPFYKERLEFNNNIEGIIEYHTSNFVITQAINKVICVIFWFYSYEELNRSADESTISVAPWLSGYFVMVA